MTLFHGMVEDWLLLAAEKTRKWSATALKAEKVSRCVHALNH